MILGYFASSPNCSPELLLRVPRVIEGGSHRFYRLMAGESEDLIAAITKGDYMPYDVDEFGRTLLCVRLAISNLIPEGFVNDLYRSGGW